MKDPDADAPPPPPRFTCATCNFSSHAEYFGRAPPFCAELRLLEDAFVIRDPNGGPRPLILGSTCAACARAVCAAPKCSIFYTKRFCTACVRDDSSLREQLPHEILAGVRRDPG